MRKNDRTILRVEVSESQKELVMLYSSATGKPMTEIAKTAMTQYFKNNRDEVVRDIRAYKEKIISAAGNGSDGVW